MQFKNFIKNYPIDLTIKELFLILTGKYTDWKTILKINRWIKITTQICSAIVLFSSLSLTLLHIIISTELSGQALNIFKKISVWQIFNAKYWHLIEHNDFQQHALFLFGFYTIFSCILFMSMFIILGCWIIKVRVCWSIYSRNKKEIKLIKSLGLNPYPVHIFKWMEKMEEINAPEKEILFKELFNQVLELQKFPNINNCKEKLLEVSNLRFSYVQENKYLKKFKQFFYPRKDHEILKNINLYINKGLFTTILGCNGSSKSTFIKAIINLFEKTSGKIAWIGKELNNISIKSFYKNVAYVAQENIIQSQTTVYDYVACGLYPSFGFFKFTYADNESVILNNLEKMGILHHKDKNINTLSGGERQKAILARVLTQGTDVIILDEPTSFLDIKSQYSILSILEKLKNEENKTIITILHDISQAKQFSDEIVIIDRGSIFAFGKTDDVITKENIEEVFEIPWN